MRDIDESRTRLSGIFNIAVTPFNPDGELDFGALEVNIERTISLGYDGLLIGGTYGEFPAMNTEERVTLFKRVMAVVEDRVPVMLCSASSDARVTRELTELAGELGGIPMIMPPYVSEVIDDHIVEFFNELAPISRTGVIIYNAPGIGITLSPKTIERIADIDGVVGLKQGDLAPATIDRIANVVGSRLKLFCASDLAFLGPMLAGFDGISSTNSCALPELILSTYRALERGDAATARDMHKIWYEYRALARELGQPQTVKAVMKLRGFNGGAVRQPLRDLNTAEVERVQQVLSKLAEEPRSGIKLPA
ncbi:dihydrodipicolinate synthase family protein [Pseudomonas sp. BF-B-25]|uniref:dihydrodipicolinate synthase family protein n=1 Tax=Pseudomonas sp. BF-B-25 TaxID=2832355 RepID=UPI001CBDDDF6|nr:dihydrodipicolinate synthase family protein [Pseudomonas sp. BF-B-25]